MLANLINQGSQQVASSPDSVGPLGAVEIDTLAGEDLRLAIQRKMDSILRDQHVRQQIRPGKQGRRILIAICGGRRSG